MAVTLTTDQLAVAMGIAVRETGGTFTITAEQRVVLDRLIAVSRALIDERAPRAPADVSNEAAIRLCGWMYDSDPAQLRFSGNPMAHSGAGAMLAPWTGQRLVGAPASAVPPAPGPSVVPDGGWTIDDLAAAVVARLLPEVGQPDAGKAMLVGSNGVWALAPVLTGVPAGGWTIDDLAAAVVARLLPEVGKPDAGKAMLVGSDGVWALVEAIWGATQLDDGVTDRLAPTGGRRSQVISWDGSKLVWFGFAVPSPISRGLLVGRSAAGDAMWLAPGQNGHVLTIVNGAPAWAVAPSGPGGDGEDPTARAAAALNATVLNSVDYVVDRFAVAMRALRGWSVDSWAVAGDREKDAGFAIGYWEQGARPSAYGDVTWDVSHVNVQQSTGYFIALRVPSGFPVPNRLRVRQVRGGSGFNWPGDGDEWLPLDLTGAPAHYDIYALYDGPTALVGIEAQAGDNLVLQVAAVSYTDPVPAIGQSVRDLQDLIDSVAVRTGVVSGWADRPGSDHHFLIGWDAIQADGTPTNAGIGYDNAHPYVVHASSAGNRVPVVWNPSGTDPETRRVVHRRAGAIIATYPRNGEYWRSYNSVKDAVRQAFGHYDPVFLASETSDAPIAVALMEGDTLTLQSGDATVAVNVQESALAAAVRAKLLPAPSVANKGKFAAIKTDGTAWEVVDAPASTPVVLATGVPRSGNENWQADVPRSSSVAVRKALEGDGYSRVFMVSTSSFALFSVEFLSGGPKRGFGFYFDTPVQVSWSLTSLSQVRLQMRNLAGSQNVSFSSSLSITVYGVR